MKSVKIATEVSPPWGHAPSFPPAQVTRWGGQPEGPATHLLWVPAHVAPTWTPVPSSSGPLPVYSQDGQGHPKRSWQVRMLGQGGVRRSSRALLQ